MKNRVKQSASLALALCMTASLLPTAFAAEPSIENHWAKEEVQQFIDKGYLLGDGKGNYGLDDIMSRAQFATILNRTMGYTEEGAEISNYTDVKQDAWYRSELAKAIAAGYMNGTSAVTMSPEQTISREQAFTMIGRALKLDAESAKEEVIFKDHDKIADYAIGYVNALAKKGYVSGNTNGEVMPGKAISRAEGVAVMARFESGKPEQTTKMKDGVYIGTGAGYGGTLKLKVTVAKGKITNIEIVSHNETPAYWRSVQKILGQIIETQSLEDVDTVSGATISAKAILTAVGACVSQAKGGPDTSETGTVGGGGGGGGNATPPEKYGFGFISNGTYRGSAAGYRGTTRVKVVAIDEKVTQIEVISSDDDVSYVENAKAVIQRMIDKQSTDVDIVSGATYSSYGIINAVADALNLKGKDTPNSNFDPATPLANGEWYGTATEGFRHGDQGPSVVKVKVADGQIEVTSHVYNDDIGIYKEKMERLLPMLKTTQNVADAADQIWKRKGQYYDAVSGATYMARGHISAVLHALGRSAKYQADPVDQQIDWMEIKTRPDHGYFDRPLDLTKTVLKVYFRSQTNPVDVPFDEFEKYGITTSWQNNDVVTKDSDRLESGNNITVKYEHALSGAHTHAQIHLDTYRESVYPDHVLVTYVNGQTEQIPLEGNHFKLEFNPTAEIDNMAIYRADQEVLRGKYDAYRKQFVFDLSKEAPLPDEQQWGVGTYIIHLTKVIDDSKITSFKAVKKNTSYLVGQVFTMNDFSIEATTEKGNTFTYTAEDAWEDRGFTVTPPAGWDEGHTFIGSDIDTRELIIQYPGLTEQKIEITVSTQKIDGPDYMWIFDMTASEKVEVEFNREDLQKLSAGDTIEKTMQLSQEEKDDWKKPDGSWDDWMMSDSIYVMKGEQRLGVVVTEASENALMIAFEPSENITGKIKLTLLFTK